MSNSLLASASRMLWRTIDSYGLDADALFEEAGLDPGLMHNPKSRYPVDNARKAWSLAAATIKDPCFGISTGKHWLATDLHALGFAFLSSSSLFTALHRIVRYNEIVDEVIQFTSRQEGNQLILSYENERKDLPDIAALEAARWSIVLTMCRTARNAPFSPLRAELMQDMPACKQAYQSFLGCEPSFGHPASCLYFDLEDIRQKLPAAHAELARLNDRSIMDYLDRLHEMELARKVASLIKNNLASGDVNDYKIAEAVFMSPRTMQRKLAKEGTSFKDILLTVKKSLAEDYIHDDRLSLTEISFLLGFSEQSSFTRAYKRWTGMTPKHARQAGRQ